MKKLYTTGLIGNSHADLCMIVANISKHAVEEIPVEKDSELEKEITKKLPSGFTLTYPTLELADGTILTQTTAIVEYLVETGAAPHLLGTDDYHRS